MRISTVGLWSEGAGAKPRNPSIGNGITKYVARLSGTLVPRPVGGTLPLLAGNALGRRIRTSDALRHTPRQEPARGTGSGHLCFHPVLAGRLAAFRAAIELDADFAGHFIRGHGEVGEVSQQPDQSDNNENDLQCAIHECWLSYLVNRGQAT